jgi:leishmanolysin
MVRAVTTIKDLTRICLSTAVCLACGAADSGVGPTPEPHFTIDVRFISTLTAQQKSAVGAAVSKWTSALFKDLGNFRLNSSANNCFFGAPALNETHHNLLLLVSATGVDGLGGLVAYTQVCSVSGQDALPILSHIRLDTADLGSMEAQGVLAGVITHELGHALGFNPKSYIPKGLAGGGIGDPYFSGATARAEFAKHASWYTGVTVPLENRSGFGPNDPHWRLSVFGDELMVAGVGPGFKSPLSAVTLALFKDLGYGVDYSVADAYEVPFAGNRVLPPASLANDFVAITPPTVISPLRAR